MQVSSEDVKKIGWTALIGTALFASLSLTNIIIKRKLATELQISCPNLTKHDGRMVVWLAQLEEILYDKQKHPILYVKLVDACEDLVSFKLQVYQLQDQTQYKSQRLEAFFKKKRAELLCNELLDFFNKNNYNESYKYSLEQLKKAIEEHFDYVLSITKLR